MNKKPFRLLPLLVAIILLASLQGQAQEPFKVVGSIYTLAIDEVDPSTGNWTGRTVLHLWADEGRCYEIEDGLGVLGKRPRGKWVVTGIKKDNKIQVTGVLPVVPNRESLSETGTLPDESLPDTIGEQKTLVALFNFPDQLSQPYTLQDVKDVFLNNTDSFDHFVRTTSYGKAWLSVDFIDFQTLPKNSTYYTYSTSDVLFTDVISTLDPLVDFKKYKRLIFYARPPAMGGGQSSLGVVPMSSPGDGAFAASWAWIFEPSPRTWILAHEVGHSFGFSHSGTSLNIPESLTDPTYSSYPYDAYGDSDDPMGVGSYLTPYSSIWRTQAQWIGLSQVQDVSQSGEYLLDPYEPPSAAAKALRIPLGRDLNGSDFHYWIEYRRELGPLANEEAIQIRTHPDPFCLPPAWVSDALSFISLTTKGGAISGQVTRRSDGAEIKSVLIWVFDSSKSNIMGQDFTDDSGIYRMKGFPPGTYYVRAYHPDFLEQYYQNASDRNAATPVIVNEGAETANINFSLTAGGTAAGRMGKGSDGSEIRNEEAMNESWGSASDSIGFGKPFYDPYRGVKVELIEKTGIGAGAKARLLVTLAGLKVSPEGVLDFGSTTVGQPSSKTVTVTNNSSARITVGQLAVNGRHAGRFSISNDSCSYGILSASQSCTVTLSFSPDSANPMDHRFGILSIPNNSAVRPDAVIDLYGFGAAPQPPDESVSTPSVPAGPTTGTTGVSYEYSTRGSIPSGNATGDHWVQYLFDWGDGTNSGWLFLFYEAASKRWTSPGTYHVKVQARCWQHPTVVSSWSGELTVSISAPAETVSAPSPPSGPNTGSVGTAYLYSTGGSTSSLGHSVQYLLDWGDGTNSDWLALGTISTTKAWSLPGTYFVRAKARCATDITFESDWSAPLTVVTANNGPDLTGTWTVPLVQTCKVTGASQRCSIKGTFTVSNFGNRDASTTYVNFYLSDNNTYEGDDPQLGKPAATGKIKPGKMKVIRLSYTFPKGQSATGKYILATIDQGGLVQEMDEANNLTVFGPVP